MVVRYCIEFSIIREDFEQHDAFICTGWNRCSDSNNDSSNDDNTDASTSSSSILPIEHGGIRLIIPHLYGWKSAKYLTELHFLPYHAKVSTANHLNLSSCSKSTMHAVSVYMHCYSN
jgi:Oxidoreductase molybdopterin binding domain